MTRKDYRTIATALARAIRNQPSEVARAAAWSTAHEVANDLNADAARFDRGKFIDWIDARAL